MICTSSFEERRSCIIHFVLHFFTVLVDDQMSDQEDTETSASTLPRPKSVTEGSAFDENSLNQSQFIHLLEKFLGHTPIK